MSQPAIPPPGTIELGLFAPYNETCSLLGSWDDFKPLPLTKDQFGWWRHQIRLEDGEYRYKFRVKSNSYFAIGQELDVFDPYCISVTNDGFENSILRVANGRRNEFSYEWKHDHVPLPPNDKLVIYEMHVGDFTRGLGKKDGDRWEKGRFVDAIEKLDHLVSLGINAVELMPIKEFPGKSWGYNLRSLFAIENTYGQAADFCRLIDECHARGMRVIVDGVYNHADADCPLAKIDYQYWFYHPNPDPPEMDWGPKYNYTHWDDNLKLFPARKYVLESIRRMVQWFHIDGIRFDATRAIRHFDVMRELAEMGINEAGKLKPFINICEHISEDPAITGYPEGGPMHAAWHESLAKVLQANAAGIERDGAQPFDVEELARKIDPATNGYGTGSRTVNYASSHDQVRLMRIIGEQGKIFDDAAFRRMKLAAGILLTIPGLPMLFMGQEFGQSNEKSLDPRPLDWSLLKNQTNSDLLNYTAGLVKFRTHHPALMTDNMEFVLKDQERQLLAYKRWNSEGQVIVVIVNLRDTHAGEVVIADCGLEDGDWHEHVHNFDLKVEGGVLKDTVAESEVKVYFKK